jgi:N-dimethylarginine dimethylaminohydrolase
MVFTANAGFVWGRKLILSNLRYDVRRVVEKNVIMNDGCPKIRRQLEAHGFSVLEVPLSEFIKAGGSAKCLVLKIPHDPSRN